MRLKNFYVEAYKNLRDFHIGFNSDSFIDIFVGKNATGKSNFFEALALALHSLYGVEDEEPARSLNFEMAYEIDDQLIKIAKRDGNFFLNEKKVSQKKILETPKPENVLIYYSGHNKSISTISYSYESSFRRRIRGSTITEARKFIEVGPEYKTILLSLVILQNTKNETQNYILEKLNIESHSNTIKIKLKRPSFATGRLKELGYKNIEDFDFRSHFWGADGITGQLLMKLTETIKSEFSHSDIYDAPSDSYEIPINIELFREKFGELSVSDQFNFFDNLRTLEMLGDLELDFYLKDGTEVSLDSFSDGQFQTVYIYAITELFKEKNSLTLLDEPDSFLHPEWQFKFLKQVFDIKSEAKQRNHIVMSSHSASTIATSKEDSLNLFELCQKTPTVTKTSASDAVKSLSAGLITFTEKEAHLNIRNTLESTTNPVLFTEGITDELILEEAWSKLYGPEERKFEVQNAFDRYFLRNLFSRDELRNNFPRRIMFALFDFDEAFDDWNGLKPANINDEESDPFKGLAKKLAHPYHYAVLLPVPNNETIKPQVLSPEGKPWGSGSSCHLSIEHLFFREEWLGSWFKSSPAPGGGTIIEFTGDKTNFATKEVPRLRADAFEVFRPLFEFIKTKIN